MKKVDLQQVAITTNKVKVSINRIHILFQLVQQILRYLSLDHSIGTVHIILQTGLAMGGFNKVKWCLFIVNTSPVALTLKNPGSGSSASTTCFKVLQWNVSAEDSHPLLHQQVFVLQVFSFSCTVWRQLGQLRDGQRTKQSMRLQQ